MGVNRDVSNVVLRLDSVTCFIDMPQGLNTWAFIALVGSFGYIREVEMISQKLKQRSLL